ncbi:hypothetical protein [Streptomyces sp. NBC_00631]|uniref:hypothetical protein n=1 Tax=Streptomyces sp. NBC_00631 TaxID=2975793 RepID=UPI00386DC543
MNGGTVSRAKAPGAEPAAELRRRVERLMEPAGAATRPQLGRHAYERGWVTRN